MKVYFKNLDGIRFFAALMVLLQHAYGFKHDYSPAGPFLERCFSDTGRMGVNLFFVLSGFLISYLLLVEKTPRARSATGASISGGYCGSGRCTWDTGWY